MNEAIGRDDHGGDAGVDVPDVGQTSREDLGQDADGGAADEGGKLQDDDIASGHLGEPGGPDWAKGSG